ncbi:MAG TPA: NHLP-related RiPP peptide, partial [Thermomonas sp.]|nr:NHLP-related RiPP peptide [Thermomonas sp.]
TKKLLDKLSTDNEFRTLFKKDAGAALAKVGYKPEAGVTSAYSCLQFSAGERIAPKSKIVRDRAKLEEAMNSIVNFDCAQGFRAD